MPFYPKDFVSDTGHLDAAETGALTLLLMFSWQKGKLPDDDKKLARIARMSDRQWQSAKPVLREFFQDGWVQPRLEKERAKALEKAQARAQCGARGGYAKALKSQEAHLAKASSLPDVCQQQNPGKALPSSSGLGLESNLEATPLVDGEPPTPIQRPYDRKKIERAESDQALLDRISDRWNAWAVLHGSPQVARLTAKRGAHCRKRIEDLMQFGHETPEAAFDWLLSKVDQSFFVRGSPRKPLEFDQLMKDEFMTRMVEGAFEFRSQHDGHRRWAS